MDYLIGLSEDKSFVKVNFKKSVSSLFVLIFTQETVRLASKYGINCYLFDLRSIDNAWGALEKYIFAQDLEKYGRKRQDKVALIVASDNNTHSFVETVTRNQGYNTRIFTDYGNAIAWFRQ